ncbi:MAG: phosphonate ABC transporter ATP-binding protein [Betaproteobacteria bacterium]|nr:phosphonate ABC transporter ATP-binding protein [Betaproteobacteria bacterium]
MTQGAALSVEGLSKSFGGPQKALKDVRLTVAPGEMVALIGASGSGKSTLLRHISGFVAADPGSGAIRVNQHVMQEGGRVARSIRHLRADVGFVFQQFNLVGRLTVMTNVLMGQLPRIPLWRSLIGRFTQAEKAEAWRAMKAVGIENLAWQRASTLSGGQQQRVAIARALVQRAGIILADEPIASLDPESARVVMEILARINREQGITVLVSLHQVQFARRYCVRTVALRLGEVVYDGPSAALEAGMLRKLYGASVEEMLDGTETIDAVMNDPVVAEGLGVAAATA